MQISFFVSGDPVPQGSKKGFSIKDRHTGKVRAILVDANAKTKPWRESIKWSFIDATKDIQGVFPIDGPVKFTATYYMRRPANHYTGTHKPSKQWRYWHTNKPDKDKLDRACFDALKIAGAITDDCRICCDGGSKKIYADNGLVGVLITIETLENVAPENIVEASAECSK